MLLSVALLVGLLELAQQTPRAPTFLARVPEPAAWASEREAASEQVDRQLGKVAHLLHGFHFITIRQKLARLGIDPTRIAGNSALEAAITVAKDRSQNSWQVVIDDPHRPPYYRHQVMNLVRWVPGKWRQRRSLPRLLSAATSSVQSVAFHDLRDDNANAAVPMRHAMWAMWAAQGARARDQQPSIARMVALWVGSATVACICIVAGARYFRQVAQPTSHASPPDGLLCPISLELMVDPVMLTGTGQTYERAAIARWLHTNTTDPITNVELHSKKLVPNFAIRKLVLLWLAEHPEFASPIEETSGILSQPTQRKGMIAHDVYKSEDQSCKDTSFQPTPLTNRMYHCC